MPSPSRALSTRIERSAVPRWNAAANVLRAGTVRPNPAPRQAVASRSRTYATCWSEVRKELTSRSAIDRKLAARPAM